jgi:type IV pilus assembly protein PilM
MFLRRSKRAKRDMIVGLDVGSRQLKAAVLQRAGDEIKLSKFGITPLAVKAAKGGSAEQLGVELQQLIAQLGISERVVRATISCSSATVFETEMPRTPIEEARDVLRLNSARYLRRDLSGFYLDAMELPDPVPADARARKSPNMRVLVAAAEKEEVRWYCTALASAKIRPEAMELSALSVVNAFYVGNTELCQKEIMLLLDIGADSTSLNFLRQGEPSMTRIMRFGGQQISEFLGSILTLPSNVAEEEKLKMTEAVQPFVIQALSPLAREIRSSIDFFERQAECRVTRAFACGGSACSPRILQFLSDEVGFRIEGWNPVVKLSTSHLNGEAKKLEAVAPSLAAAIGAAAPHV